VLSKLEQRPEQFGAAPTPRAPEHRRLLPPMKRVVFNDMPWETSASGVRFKVQEVGASRLRLLEFTRELNHPHWCETGHIGYVLDGELEIEFDDESVIYRAGDGVSIMPGRAERHRPHARTERVRLIFVEEPCKNGDWSPMVRRAQTEDRPAVEALLATARLPTDGVAEHFDSFFVVDNAGRIVGAAGFELYREHALVRSVVVAEDSRGAGVGSMLTQRALREAYARGARAIYLLTTTAEEFFAGLGFERTTRLEVPQHVHVSRELQGACPASATVMRRGLDSDPETT
jgi:amino-acid N-acetyltransferase